MGESFSFKTKLFQLVCVGLKTSTTRKCLLIFFILNLQRKSYFSRLLRYFTKKILFLLTVEISTKKFK